jgi:asparagine synthase (glutamine-hydrolysing)
MTQEFGDFAHDLALGEVHRSLKGTGKPWWPATDDFYVFQRMQRWAGCTSTAVCFERYVVNPMLSPEFLRIAEALPPRAKQSMRFLSRLQVALDEDLARLPMDGRPAPIMYAKTGLTATAGRARLMGRKVVGKARQRLHREHHPPAGGSVLAAHVVEHWRQDPSMLDGVRELDIVRSEWLESMCSGRIEPEPATISLLINLSGAVAAAAR